MKHYTVNLSACSFWCIRGVYAGRLAGTPKSHKWLTRISSILIVPSLLDGKNLPLWQCSKEQGHLEHPSWRTETSRVALFDTEHSWRMETQRLQSIRTLQLSLWAYYFLQHSTVRCYVARHKRIQYFSILMLYILVVCTKTDCMFMYSNALNLVILNVNSMGLFSVPRTVLYNILVMQSLSVKRKKENVCR